MTIPKSAVELDERLARLGREWFAEVRRQHPDVPAARPRQGDGADDAADGLLDLLFGDAGDGDGGGDGGSD